MKMLSYNISGDSVSLGEFSLTLFIGIAGILLTIFLRKEFSFYFLLIVLISLITAFSYSIPDINEYFLVVFFVLSLSGIIPLTLITTFIYKNKFYKLLLYATLVLFIFIQILTNFHYADRSKFYVIEDFFKSSLKSLPKNSILLTDNWGSILSPALYYQNVEKFRTDISIVSPSGYIEFDWYRKNKNIDIYDSAFVIHPKENLFVAFDVMYRIIGKSILKLPEHYTLIPLKYFYVVGIDTVYYPYINLNEKIRFSKQAISESEKYIKALIPNFLEQRINYELAFKKNLQAENLFEQLKKEYPDYKISSNTLVALYQNKILK